ncbi:SPOR domain-containing protein [Fibrella sp. WM1]|uniref:HU domain-containing protein n=1 Tax=Fibrella musci TaxID=3242485 RepID=UPI00352007B6
MAMRPISDYLKKLLYQYDCLVVPALGAFLTHNVSASYNETTGQFLPPRRKVAFNEALRLDDGILVNYIVLHENCSREEALQAISQFVTDLKQQTREAGSFVIEGLGMFSLNSENNLQFDPELRHNFLGNAYGFQPLMLTRQMVHPAVPVLEKPVVVKSLPTMALTVVSQPTQQEVGEVLPMPITSQRTQPTWRWAAAAIMVGTLGFISYFSVIKPNESLQSSLNPGNLFRLPNISTEKTTLPASDAATPAPTVATPAIAPVANAVPAESAPTTLASTPAANESVTKSALALVEAVSSSRKAAAKAAEKVVAKKPAAVVTAEPAAPQAPFTVIAGSFASRSNAIRFQKMLKRAGYEQAYILPGRTKGLIKVAAVGTEAYDDAKANLDSLNALTGITPWILRSR